MLMLMLMVMVMVMVTKGFTPIPLRNFLLRSLDAWSMILSSNPEAERGSKGLLADVRGNLTFI
jgi:hypothetical protein